MQKKVQKLHNLLNILDRKLHEKPLAHTQGEAWANFFAQFKMGRLEAKDIVVGAEVAIAAGHNKKANDILVIAYELMPTSFIVLEALVQTFRNLNQDKKAELHLRKHLEKNPDDWNVTRLLGRLFFHTNQKNKHIEIVESYISKHPQHVAARIELASQKWSSNADDIEDALLEILAIDPDNFYALSQLSQYFAQIPDFSAAYTYLEKIQTLYPEEALRYFCEGFINEQQLEFEKALNCYDKAIEINPHFIEAYGKSGLLMHKLGLDIDEAWYRLEARFPQLLNRPSGPFWRGEDLTGKYLLIWAEQGIGDQLDFASMLRDLPKDLARVDVECDQKLVPLFKRSFPEYNIYPRRTVRDKGYDFHSPIGAIARYLRPSYDSFTDSPARFLIPNDQDVQKWQGWLKGLGNGLKVGLCWRSGTKSVVRSRDSIDLCDDLSPVLKMEGVTFINLMYGDARDELQSVQEILGVHIHQPPQLDQFNDVDQTAALIKGLDVVVGIATSPIGLAQGVGCASVLLYTGEPGKLAPLWWPGTTYLTRAMDEGWGTVVEQLSDYLNNYPERR